MSVKRSSISKSVDWVEAMDRAGEGLTLLGIGSGEVVSLVTCDGSVEVSNTVTHSEPRAPLECKSVVCCT